MGARIAWASHLKKSSLINSGIFQDLRNRISMTCLLAHCNPVLTRAHTVKIHSNIMFWLAEENEHIYLPSNPCPIMLLTMTLM